MAAVCKYGHNGDDGNLGNYGGNDNDGKDCATAPTIMLAASLQLARNGHYGDGADASNRHHADNCDAGDYGGEGDNDGVGDDYAHDDTPDSAAAADADVGVVNCIAGVHMLIVRVTIVMARA